MELSKKLQDALNAQIKKEYDSAFKYHGMTLYFKKRGMPGTSRWMKNQMIEETEHAEDFIDLIFRLDGDVELKGLEEEPTEYNSLLEVFEKGLEHEKFISKSIRALLELAIEEKNYVVENFLRKYIDEQAEEEDNFRGVIDMIKMAGEDKAALFKVDSILGKRD